jgi:hypothetical protein
MEPRAAGTTSRQNVRPTLGRWAAAVLVACWLATGAAGSVVVGWPRQYGQTVDLIQRGQVVPAAVVEAEAVEDEGLPGWRLHYAYTVNGQRYTKGPIYRGGGPFPPSTGRT